MKNIEFHETLMSIHELKHNYFIVMEPKLLIVNYYNSGQS